MSSLKKEKLRLLEKLVQSSSEGDITTEQKDLFVNLVKETNPKSPKMRKKPVKESIRPSRDRVKIVRNNSHEIDDKTHGKVTIPMPDRDPVQRSRSRSRSDSSDSSSSFWSSGSQDRARMVKRSSSRSSYSSSSRSHSRSRSSSSETTPRQSSSHRERSKSPPASKTLLKEPRSESFSSTQSAPVQNSINRHDKNINESASDLGRKGRRKKLSKRGEVRKYKSFDINPDVFIEEKIKQKYKELHKLMRSQFSGSANSQLTHQQFQQMQTLREQYVSASHGLPPSGVLVPRSLPASMRVRGGAPQGLTKLRSRSRDTLSSTASDLGEDHNYSGVQRVLYTSAAREGNIIVDPRPVNASKKKKKVKKSNSETKLNSTFDTVSDQTGSRTLSPRSRLNIPEVHHLKDSKNPDLIKWLKLKDKEHRKKEKEERKKKREEREKLVLEANEKFERRLESKKFVDQWMVDKEKEYRMMMKQKKREEKEAAKLEKARMEKSLPGSSIMIRPQTAPSNWKHKSDSNLSYRSSKDLKDKVNKSGKSYDRPLTVQDQLGTSSDQIKFDLNDSKSNDPLPQTSKFMYKRPVAGKIRLKMQGRPMSAQPKLQSSPEKNIDSSSANDERENKSLRMTYDDWVNSKRKMDQEKRKTEKHRQKEELSKSDPEIAKIVPDIAKKRIHNLLNERKSIDTGIKRYDAATIRSFGGGSFDDSKSPKTPTKGHAYKWADDRPSTAKDKTSLKVSGKSYRPGTAPAGRRVPVPERSPFSPVPPRVEEVMNNEDETNPFKLPFPPSDGVPTHVADMQRKLFSEHIITKNEVTDSSQKESESTALVPRSELAPEGTSSSEDIKYDNIRAIEHTADDTGSGKKADETQYVNAAAESTQENDSFVKKEETGDDNGEEDETSKDSELPEDDKENELDTHLDLPKDNSEEEEQSTRKEKDKTEGEKSSEEITEGQTEVNQSNKHVSFCEEPEVFVDTDRQEWSTDTDTPDEDNSRYTTKEDLSTLIDNCGELLNKEYGDYINREGDQSDDKAFLTESLDEDF